MSQKRMLASNSSSARNSQKPPNNTTTSTTPRARPKTPANIQQVLWDKPSPFLIPPIFEVFREHLSYYQLMEYRTVCKEWFLMIDPIIDMKKGILVVQTPLTNEIIEAILILHQPNKFNEIILVQNFDIMPHQINLLAALSYNQLAHVSTLNLVKYNMSRKTIQKILCKLESLAVLKIDRPSASNIDKKHFDAFIMCNEVQPQSSVKNLASLQTQVRKFPNLKVFHLKDCNYSCITSIEDISTVFPELTELNFNANFYKHNYKFHKPDLVPVRCQELPKLRRLSLNLSTQEKCYFRLFSTILPFMKSKLYYLELRELVPKFPETQIKKFLTAQQLTLQTLILTSTEDFVLNPDIPLIIPNLPKLKKLHVSEHIIIKGLPITLSSVPNITELILEFKSSPNFAMLFPRKKKVETGCHSYLNVKSLSISKIGAREFSELSKWLPNVTKISLIECDDDLLKIIYTKFNQIKVLNIGTRSNSNYVTDSAIVGFITEEEIIHQGMQDVIYGSNNNHFVHIGCLKELEELQITYSAESSNKLTWLSYVFGITQLPKLKKAAQINLQMDFVPAGRVFNEFMQRGFEYSYKEVQDYLSFSTEKLILAEVFTKTGENLM